MSCASALFGGAFTPEEIERARTECGLLTLELEVGTQCNFACRYCYVGDAKPTDRNELTPDEQKNAAEQAQALGARKIILLGGEPLLYPHTPDFCEWMRKRGLGTELFTNGTNLTRELAERLHGLGVHVVLKWHSPDPRIQDELAGVAGAHTVMANAYRHLRTAGYPSPDARLALSTPICRQNIAGLPAMWRHMRAEGIEPYFEMITPQGRARRSENELAPSADETRRLFETIQAIDRDEFARVWDAQPPLVGNVCLRHQFSCLVNAAGDVMPCVGVPLPVGNIRRRPLADILADSEVIADLRDHSRTIQGACGSCEKAAGCYGCRGAAYHLTGNYLGSDPLCWRNQGGVDCARFPMAADRLVPHRPPARLVVSLDAVAERAATATARADAESPHCRGGVLTEAAHLEAMAQAAAALHGYRAPGQRGMLVGAKGLEIHAPVVAGETMTVTVRKEARLGAFGIVRAELRRADGTLASEGELKTWHEEP
jgi:radical SAM protein with 4Fe4S-binding SPASM domain